MVLRFGGWQGFPGDAKSCQCNLIELSCYRKMSVTLESFQSRQGNYTSHAVWLAQVITHDVKGLLGSHCGFIWFPRGPWLRARFGLNRFPWNSFTGGLLGFSRINGPNRGP